MSKFKVGDRVRAVANPTSKYYSNAGYFNAGEEFTVEEVFPWQNTVKLVEDDGGWSEERFELVEPVSAATLTTPVVPQLPGIPEGYRAVRIGTPAKGEWYIDPELDAVQSDGWQMAGGYVILEKIDPVEPVKPEAPVAPAKKVAPTFKKGDRVRLVDNSWGYSEFRVGTVGTITDIVSTDANSGLHLLYLDGVMGSANGMFAYRFELVEDAKIVTESPDDLVIQDRVPAREGVDFGWWVDAEEFDKFVPKSNQKWNIQPSSRVGRMHGLSDRLAVMCYRKDLPIAERVVLDEYLVWDTDGPKCLLWVSSNPTLENDSFYEWDHACPTGNTREVEVPIVKP